MFNYNPYQPNPYPQPTNNLIKVKGVNGAKAYQMNLPNSSMVFFDEDENVFYLKTTDEACFPTLRMFEYKEKIIKTEHDQNEYITRDEFNQLIKEIQNAKQHIPTAGQPGATDAVS